MPYSSPASSESVRVSVGLDKVLQSLQESFNGIEWLEGKIYLRAYTDTFPNAEGDNVTSPQVYMGNGEYHDASINDHLDCAMFFQAKGSEKIVFQKPRDFKSLSQERKLSLVFWCNLVQLAENFPDDYIFTEQIKVIFLRKLAKSTYVVSVEEYVDEPIESVFEGFTFFDGRQYNKHPYAGIRIDFTVKYDLSIKECS